MALEFCSENCEASSVSPRISFSHDISQSDVIPVEQQQQHPFGSNSSGLNSSIEFDFCVSESFELDSSSADELFSDGRILPTQVKKKNPPLKKTLQLAPHPPLLPPSYATTCNNASSSTSKNLKIEENYKESKFLNDEVCDKQSSKSFWSFKRSSSCGSVYGRSLCPFPLLSRSNSTGSNTSVKRSPMSKEGANIKKNSQKHSPSRFSPSLPNNYQRPPLNKSHGSYGNNSVRVSPILNVPSANLFGLGSIFSNNRYKSKKK